MMLRTGLKLTLTTFVLLAMTAPGLGQTYTPPAKSKSRAILMSVVPGLGQHYLGAHLRGVAMEVTFLAGAAMLANGYASDGGGYRTERSSYDYDNVYYYYNGYESYMTGTGYAGIALMLGSIGWSLIDSALWNPGAPSSTDTEPSFGHLLETKTGDKVVGFDVARSSGGWGGSVSFHF